MLYCQLALKPETNDNAYYKLNNLTLQELDKSGVPEEKEGGIKLQFIPVDKFIQSKYKKQHVKDPHVKLVPISEARKKSFII